MLRHLRAFAAALFLCASAAAPARAQLPSTTLSALQPPGGKIGTTFDVTVASAANAEGADRLLFSHPGITAAPKSEPSVLFPGERDATPGQFTVTVAADLAPGIYDARLAGPLGVSNPRGFAIDTLNEIAETADNHAPDTAQPIEVGSVVSGKFDANSNDWFKFSGKSGARVLIDVAAQRIDSRADATLVVYDSAGRELARSRDVNRRDPLIDLVLPADGEYRIKAYDFVFAGGTDHFYRMAVHTGPRIAFVFPPVAMPGQQNRLAVFGRNLPGGATSEFVVNGRPLDRLDVTVDVPADEPTDRLAAPPPASAAEALIDGREFRLNASGGGSNAVLLGYAQAPLIVEAEPNDTLEKTPTVTLPCEVVGRFFPRGDLDAVQFEAKKGDVVAIQAISERMGCVADPWLLVERVVQGSDGKREIKDIKEIDDESANIGSTAFDTATSDPSYRLTVPEDGLYRVVVRDLYGDSRGDPRLVYRLVLRKPRPDFRLLAAPVTIAKGANNTSGAAYKATGVLIRSGEVSPFTVMAARIDGFDGPIRLSVEGLPSGVSAPEAIVGVKTDLTPLTIVVPEGTPAWQGTIRIVGRATVDGVEIRHEARAMAILAPGDARRSAEARLAQEFAVALGGADVMPCTVQAGDGATLAGQRGSKVTVPVKMIRRGDFKGAATLTPIGLPSYAKAQPLTVGDQEATLTIEIDKEAPLGELTFALSGVIPKFEYTRDKTDIDTAAKRRDQAMQAVADLVKLADEAKAQAAAAPEDKKAEANQAVAAALGKVGRAEAAKKVLESQAAALAAAGKPKSVTNVPVVSTLIRLAIAEQPPQSPPPAQPASEKK